MFSTDFKNEGGSQFGLKSVPQHELVGVIKAKHIGEILVTLMLLVAMATAEDTTTTVDASTTPATTNDTAPADAAALDTTDPTDINPAR
ncbi:hypothetical protein MSG28_008797 [Choristoneura fumiferana]|uniref:Uncharacterized protein n=1 Tax=Choristoneura fumiferana TaxID=7141 RepID=A0ACC0J848_CHOFU|nr:hypothetical protein MSG28_008797 [Choristoneura fumiferana]